MKTSRHESANGFPRHLRQTRLLRKLLKAHNAATYDRPAVQHAAQARCTGGYDLAIALEKTEIAERMVPEIHITPPPLYHEVPRSAPAVREVPRFRPTIHQPDPDTRAEYSVASLGSTVLTNVPLLSAGQSPTLSNLDAMDLRRCASASTLLPPTAHHRAPPLRHHRSADNLLLLAGSARHSSAAGPTTTTTTLLTPASPLGSHPVNPSSPTSISSSTEPAQRPKRRSSTKPPPPALKRASSYPLISVSIMTPIREEPRSPRPPTPTTKQHRRLPSILRGSPTSSPTTTTTTGGQKRVRFEIEQLAHEPGADADADDAKDDVDVTAAAAPSFQHDRLVVFAMAVVAASLLLLLACADSISPTWASWPRWSARAEYAVAFAVGCGVAHWLSASGVAEVVGGTLGRAREEGWV